MITLGLSKIPAPARPARPRVEMGELGATGTPIFGGYITDVGEYNAALAGLSAFTTYEKMRRSDAQVAATLTAIKLPIRSAQWEVREPADASPREKEATEFVRQELFQEEIEWDAVLENALLMLDFGCAAHVDHWMVDGGRVRIRKLKPILPVTFQRWLVDPVSEELLGIEQYGAKADTYVTETVEVDRLALFTFGQEGNNFAGRALLRPMYGHWFIKSNLYKIDAIAHERNGMGVPTMIMGENPTAEDIKAAKTYLDSLTAHQKAGVLLPNGWMFTLEGVKGTIRDSLPSITHHNVQISKAGLAQFLDLGQSESGNRALGQSQSDFFMLALEATANKIARVMNWTTIPRLVDFNFAGVERYPELVPQQILSIKFETLMAALKDLAGSRMIEPDDDLEAHLREKLGVPEKDAKSARRTVVPAPEDPLHRRDAEGAEEAQRKTAEKPEKVAASDGGLKLRREVREHERCLALADIAGELDRGRDAIAAALRRAKDRVQAEIVLKLMRVPLEKMHRASMDLDERLAREVEAELRAVFGFGRAQVDAERERQRAGGAPADARVVRAAAARPRTPRKKRTALDTLAMYADAVVSEFQNAVQARAAAVALDWRRRPGELTDGEIVRRIEEELDAQSEKWIDPVASKGANEAFADGRAEGYEEHADEIARVIYSALLDINCCENCVRADGAEGATPEEIPGVPNPDCDGGDRCRCVHVFVFSDEGKVTDGR